MKFFIIITTIYFACFTKNVMAEEWQWNYKSKRVGLTINDKQPINYQINLSYKNGKFTLAFTSPSAPRYNVRCEDSRTFESIATKENYLIIKLNSSLNFCEKINLYIKIDGTNGYEEVFTNGKCIKDFDREIYYKSGDDIKKLLSILNYQNEKV